MTLEFATSIISLTMRRRALLLAALPFLLAFAACGDGDDVSGTGTPVPSRAELTPPLEGGDQALGPSEFINFRELAELQLPKPEDLPPPPEDADAPEFNPPLAPECPEDWLEYPRSAEGFLICYPQGWEINGDGYVTLPFQDRWYSAGIYMFDGDVQAAHVSVYTINPRARPYTYTLDCDQPYAVTFAGQPSVLCPDAPGAVFPEQRIISYHTRTDQFDYFVNIVPFYTHDSGDGSYGDSVDSDLEELAIEIAHTFQLTEPVPR